MLTLLYYLLRSISHEEARWKHSGIVPKDIDVCPLRVSPKIYTRLPFQGTGTRIGQVNVRNNVCANTILCGIADLGWRRLDDIDFNTCSVLKEGGKPLR